MRSGVDWLPLASRASFLGLLNKTGRYSEAADLLKEGKPAARRVWDGNHSKWLGNFLAKLGKAQFGLSEYPTAEATLLEAHELLAAGFGGDHARTTKTTKNIISLYDAWHAAEPGDGYDAKASEWRGKLTNEESSDGQ